ncbi:DNA primase large subunit, eukaryotic/archaeal [Phytophthora cactorum]|nr:DNA primase large subunit, eukaryotic/archaeal [Phytophthora cactorum]
MKEIEARQSKLKAVRDANDLKVRGQPLPAYFKVPFTEALDLVATRRVYIEAVSIAIAIEGVIGAFRKYNRSLISKDERLAPVLSNLAKHHIDADYSSTPVPGSENAIRPDMIDGLAATSMPLCMRSLHKGLKLSHHLKFAGRQQYGLFLKGMGLQLDDAIAYWKQEFCKKMSVDDFNKKYAYNIRHNYGKEGKRKDYAPSNCMRIITGDPPRTESITVARSVIFEQEHLRKALQAYQKETNRRFCLSQRTTTTRSPAKVLRSYSSRQRS